MLSTDDTMNRLNQSKIADLFGFDGVHSIKSTASIGKRMSAHGLMTTAASDGGTDDHRSSSNYKSILTGGFQR